jgi:type I restriction enzyme S subunit
LSISNGTTILQINNYSFKGLKIFVPSIPEQKRIVAILDQVFDNIDKAHATAEINLKNARELFDSYLQQVFNQNGEGVSQVKLSQITECISDGDHSAPPKSEHGIPFITISNINKSTNEIDFSHTFKVPEGYYASLKETRKPRVGDVLYTVTGSYGIPVVVREAKEFCFQRHIGLIRPSSVMDSKWLYYLLMSPQFFKKADEGATGTAQKTVSLTLLRSILVPNIQLDIQKEMVKKLDFLYLKSKALEHLYLTKASSLDELRKSILQKAFTGQLTKSKEIAL